MGFLTDRIKQKEEEANRAPSTSSRRLLAELDVPEAPEGLANFGNKLRGLVSGVAQRASTADTGLELSSAGDAYRATKAGFSKVIDLLSRGMYFSTAYADKAATLSAQAEAAGQLRNPVRWFGNGMAALKAGLVDAFTAEKGMGFLEVMKKHTPEFVDRNPKSAWILGLVGDVVLDPLNLVGLGEAKSAVRVTTASGRVVSVSRAAQKVTMRELLELTGEGTRATLKTRLKNAVLKEEPHVAAQIEHTDNLLSSMEADIRSRFSTKYGETQKKLEASYAPEAKPGVVVEGVAKNPDEYRHGLLGELTDAERLFKEEMDVLHALRNRAENAAQARNSARLQTLNEFLESRPSQNVLHDFVIDTAESRFASLLDDPEFYAKVRDLGGVKVAGGSVIPGDSFKKFAEAVHLPALKERVKALADEPLAGRGLLGKVAGTAAKGADATMSALSRNWRLPEEYVRMRKEFESALHSTEIRARAEQRRIFGNLAPESRERISVMARAVDDTRGRMMRANANPAEIDQAARQIIDAHQLEPQEMAAYARMRQKFNDFRALEQELGLLESLREEYHPVSYRLATESTSWFGMRRMRNRQLEPFLGPAEARRFIDEEAAKAAGYDPITDAATLYMLRSTQHHRAVSQEMFRRRVESMFPNLKVSKGEAVVLDSALVKAPVKDKDGKVITLAGKYKDGDVENVLRDITYMGEGAYNPRAWKIVNFLAPKYDGALGFVRRAATTVRPSFGMKQAVSNAMQSYLVLGHDVFRPSGAMLAASAIRKMGAFDPRSTIDALHVLSGEARGFSIRTALGTKLTGEQIAKEMLDHGVVRGITLDGVGAKQVGGTRWIRSWEKELNREARFERIGKGWSGSAGEGFHKAMSELAHYTDWPSKIEDFSRATMYVTARRMGFSPAEAARKVDEALFDYMHGLSEVEAKFFRRGFPFYSYRRFAIPLIARVLTHTPGRVANVAKATDKFFEAYGKLSRGESLTEEERHDVLPGWVMEQPHAVAQRTGIFKQVVTTFNGFSPIDVLSEFMPGEDDVGDSGVRRWIEKAFMSQMTPFIKTPIETLAQKEFFTGREFNTKYDRNVHDLNPDVLLATLAAEITMSASGNAKLAALAGGATAGVEKMSPEAAKHILKTMVGWEEGTDPKTGKRTVYVNPYWWALMGSMFPPLNDAARLSRKDRTPLAKARGFLFGAQDTEVDLQQNAVSTLRRRKGQILDKKEEVRRRAIEQRHEAMHKSLDELNELVDTITEEARVYSPYLNVPPEEAP